VPPRPARFEVHSFETDPCGRLTLPALCAFLQEAARLDAEAMGAGVEVLARQGLVWMMHRLCLRITAVPRIGATLDVATWAKRWERVAAQRDFEVRDAGGERVAAGTSRWTVVDLAQRHVVRLPAFIRALPLPERAPALVFDGEGPPRVALAECERRIAVRRGDLDAARHVTCARYVEWALEAVPDAWLDAHRPAGFEIVFQRESLGGDVVLARAQRLHAGAGWAHQLVRAAGGEELACAVSLWQPLAVDEGAFPA
jgi:acyl-ACP thioesterase